MKKIKLIVFFFIAGMIKFLPLVSMTQVVQNPMTPMIQNQMSQVVGAMLPMNQAAQTQSTVQSTVGQSFDEERYLRDKKEYKEAILTLQNFQLAVINQIASVSSAVSGNTQKPPRQINTQLVEQIKNNRFVKKLSKGRTSATNQTNIQVGSQSPVLPNQ